MAVRYRFLPRRPRKWQCHRRTVGVSAAAQQKERSRKVNLISTPLLDIVSVCFIFLGASVRVGMFFRQGWPRVSSTRDSFWDSRAAPGGSAPRLQIYQDSVLDLLGGLQLTQLAANQDRESKRPRRCSSGSIRAGESRCGNLQRMMKTRCCLPRFPPFLEHVSLPPPKKAAEGVRGHALPADVGLPIAESGLWQ